MINICIIATIVIYLVGMLLVGFVYSKSNEDSSDFYLGGRTMGPLVTAMSAEASDMSSWLLMGMPGLAYLTGIASPGWTARASSAIPTFPSIAPPLSASAPALPRAALPPKCSRCRWTRTSTAPPTPR